MKDNLITLPAGRPKEIPVLTGANSNYSEKNFKFEGQLYRAVYNAPGHSGLMIFTGRGSAVEKCQFPELWMYYQHQEEYLQSSNREPKKFPF